MAVITTSRTEKGMMVASATMAGMNSVSVGVWIRAGARDERASETGIAHFLEHMAFKGTSKRSAFAIAKEIEDVGGFMNAHTGREETAYYVTLLPEHLELGFDILSDILVNSAFPAHEIERERGVIIQEIGQSTDTPDDYVFECFNRTCYGDHTLGNSILGTSASVSAFQDNDLSAFMRRHYGAGQMIVCVAGPVSHAQATMLAARYFSAIGDAEQPVRTAPLWQSASHLAQRDLEQAHIVFGLQAPDALSHRRHAMMVLSNLYGGGMSSRLFQKVREERGLCYSVFSFAQMFSDTGLFGVYAGTAADSIDELLSVCAAELRDCVRATHMDEIARAKQQLRAGLLMRSDSVSSMMEATARQLAVFGRTTDNEELLAKIEAVSRTDISELAEELVSTSAPALCVVGPATQIPTAADLASMLA